MPRRRIPKCRCYKPKGLGLVVRAAEVLQFPEGLPARMAVEGLPEEPLAQEDRHPFGGDRVPHERAEGLQEGPDGGVVPAVRGPEPVVEAGPAGPGVRFPRVDRDVSREIRLLASARPLGPLRDPPGPHDGPGILETGQGLSIRPRKSFQIVNLFPRNVWSGRRGMPSGRGLALLGASPSAYFVIPRPGVGLDFLERLVLVRTHRALRGGMQSRLNFGRPDPRSIRVVGPRTRWRVPGSPTKHATGQHERLVSWAFVERPAVGAHPGPCIRRSLEPIPWTARPANRRTSRGRAGV